MHSTTCRIRFLQRARGLTGTARRTRRRHSAGAALCVKKADLQQSARGVGQTNRKSMAIEARRRQSVAGSRLEGLFTALFTARAVPCGHRSIQGFKQQEQQADSHTVALDTGTRMTHEARRRRRPWRSATPNIGAQTTRARTKRHWVRNGIPQCWSPGGSRTAAYLRR